jgi:hypothetical protein
VVLFMAFVMLASLVGPLLLARAIRARRQR